MRAALLVAVVVLAVARQACADDCANTNSQADLNECSGAQLTQADAALNAVYTKLLAEISPEGQASLRGAERAWLVYRDKQCSFDTLESLSSNRTYILNF